MLKDISRNPQSLAIGIMWGFDGGMRAWETGVFTKHGGYRDDIRASAFYLTEGLSMGSGRHIALKQAPNGKPYSGAIGINWSRAEHKRNHPEYGASFGKQYPILHEAMHHWLTDCPSAVKGKFMQDFAVAVEKDRMALSSSLRSYVASLRDARDSRQEYPAFCLEMACGGQRKLMPSDREPLFDFAKAPHIVAVLESYFPDLALFQQPELRAELMGKGQERHR